MSLRRSVFFSFLAKYSETLIFTVSSIVLARVLTPQEIGIFSVGAAAAAVSSALRDFGLGNYLLQVKDITPAVVRSVFWIGLLISSATAGAMVVAAPYIAAFYNDQRVAEVIYILTIGFLVIPVSVPAMTRIKRNMDFVSFSKIAIVVSLGQTGTSIYLGVEGYGANALACGATVNILMSTLLALYFMPVFDWLRPDFSEWRPIVRFGMFSSATGTVGEIGRSGTDLLIGRITGLDAVALFSRAQGVTDLFNRLFQDALGQIAVPAAAQSLRDGGDAVTFYLRATQLLTAVSWPFFLVLVLVADEMVMILFGSQWTAVVLPAQILCFARIIGGLNTFVGAVLIARGAMNVVFGAQVAVTIANVVGIAIGAAIGLEALAVASCVLHVFSVAVYHRALNRVGRIEWRAIAVSVGPSLVVALATFAVALLVRWGADALQVGPVATFLAIGVVSGAVWLCAIAAVDHPIWKEVGIILRGAKTFRLRGS